MLVPVVTLDWLGSFPVSPLRAFASDAGKLFSQALAVQEQGWGRGGSHGPPAKGFPFFGGPRARPHQAELFSTVSQRGRVMMGGHGS